MMGDKVGVNFTCYCGMTGLYGGADFEDAEQRARDAGWRLDKVARVAICPDCETDRLDYESCVAWEVDCRGRE